MWTRSISSCSGFIWPFLGKDWLKSSPYSRTHLRNTFSWTSRSRAAWATATPRSLTSYTASSLYSRLNFLRYIHALRFQEEHLNSVSMKPAAGQVFEIPYLCIASSRGRRFGSLQGEHPLHKANFRIFLIYWLLGMYILNRSRDINVLFPSLETRVSLVTCRFTCGSRSRADRRDEPPQALGGLG